MVTRWLDMCPKLEKLIDYGHKMAVHVPETREARGLRSQDGRTCARNKRNSLITVTRWLDMCPKQEKLVDYGHRMAGYVPETREARGLRSQDGRTCARNKSNSLITVTRWLDMCPKQEKLIHFGHMVLGTV
ncbi:hypothetical protein DYI25_17640 [Mesobacillus boroniphilus]|uniref:Uncharacterized protein n=1 Tax=Mesobacillus boroniphilus TaxID=308892 RepID=A0A944CNK4_9BACI|nr:hypothetical protein [Mesobacillus boroniphilus]MBS8266250.1 hypothetical protein [Mesobacillus boroniphilus]